MCYIVWTVLQVMVGIKKYLSFIYIAYNIFYYYLQ